MKLPFNKYRPFLSTKAAQQTTSTPTHVPIDTQEIVFAFHATCASKLVKCSTKRCCKVSFFLLTVLYLLFKHRKLATNQSMRFVNEDAFKMTLLLPTRRNTKNETSSSKLFQVINYLEVWQFVISVWRNPALTYPYAMTT